MFSSIVEAVFSHGERTPDKLCIADDKTSLTYAEYADAVKRYVTVYEKLGVRRGDHVVMEAKQSTDYLASELALQLMGAVFVPVENKCAETKIASFADRVKASVVVTVKDDAEGRYVTYDRVAELFGEAEAVRDYTLPEKDTVSEILFSTGTTGREKGIILTHGNDIALAENVMYGVEMEKDNVEMIPSPMNHSHGLRRYYANMYNGSTVIILGSVMDVRRFFSNMETYGVNSMDLVPAALAVLLRLSKGKLADYADTLRYLQLGAAPLPEADKNAVCALLPKTRIYNFYGSTESGCTCIYNFNVAEPKKNCIGKPTHNTRLLVVDDDRVPFESNPEKTGALATAGGMNTLGYFEDEEETSRVLADGIVYSNDIGYVDGDGDVILLGRRGDVINVGGNKVSPEEIEDAAKKIDGIADCGCIPVEDSAKGHVPKLFVEMVKGREFDMKAIRSALAATLEPYKVPVYIVEIEKIPRSYNGKLLRKELKD
ncbi:MAG: acyl--CoA ligase [Clostridia bacterium]|nr:acyl--CoA ligase [Clostridia bacterium]